MFNGLIALAVSLTLSYRDRYDREFAARYQRIYESARKYGH